MYKERMMRHTSLEDLSERVRDKEPALWLWTVHKQDLTELLTRPNMINETLPGEVWTA